MVVEHRIESSITCHAWNGSRTELAVCPNDETVCIYRIEHAHWRRVGQLREHDALVTSIAWGEKTDRIVTTAQDRNAYVWTRDGEEWKPMLVILRITAAATSVRWSPDEQKFAVGSGSKSVPVCSYEEANNFWVSKMIKEHASTVCAVAWHPTAPIVATASTDYHCRVFSAFLKNLDSKDTTTPWGAPAKFGTLLYTFEAYGWVLDVAFSPTGETLALCAQNSSVTFIDVAAAAAGSNAAAQTLRLHELPLTHLLFLPDGTLVGAGHCFSPLVFGNAGGKWMQPRKLQASPTQQTDSPTAVSASRRIFQAQTSTGRSEGTASLDSVHQFPVCGLQLFNASMDGVRAEFTSSALDGKIVGWTADELSAAMRQLSVA